MQARFHVKDTTYIVWPPELFGILRACQQELPFGQLSRRNTKKLFDLGLAIRGISAHIAEVAKVIALQGTISFAVRIEGAIQGHSSTRTKIRFQLGQQRASSKTEIKIKVLHVLRFEIWRP